MVYYEYFYFCDITCKRFIVLSSDLTLSGSIYNKKKHGKKKNSNAEKKVVPEMDICIAI